MTEKVPTISRGQPITAEYLNALARAVNAGQIVLPASAAGGAAISSPAGSGSSPASDNRAWTITSVTTVGGIADTLTMTDGLGAIWTISNLGDLCAVCGGGGGGAVTNYIMAVSVQIFVNYRLTFYSGPHLCTVGSYNVYQLQPKSYLKYVIFCQNGTHDATVYSGAYVKLLNGGVDVTEWNYAGTISTTLFTSPNVPSDIPPPASCVLDSYTTMSRHISLKSETANCTAIPDFPSMPTFDQLQILAADNATILWDLDLSGTACEDYDSGNTPSTTANGNSWVSCGLYYVQRTGDTPDCWPAPPSEPSTSPVPTDQTLTYTLRKSWILAPPA